MSDLKTLNRNINTERNFGIDIIKIFAMFLVTLLHITGIGGAVEASESIITKVILSTYEGIGFCCINLFALSTGFLYYGKKNKYNRLISLWIQIVFWAIAGNIIPALYYRNPSIFLQTPFVRIFVVSFMTYWYVNAYIALFIFIPLLNRAVEKMTEKSFVSFSIITTVMFCVLPFTFGNDLFNTNKGYSFIWLAYLFIIGAGFKKFDIVNRTKTSVVIIVGLIGLAFESSLVFLSSIEFPTPHVMRHFLNGYACYPFVFTVLASYAIFILMARIKTNKNGIRKIITTFSAASFSVYLIQCNHAVWEAFFVDKFKFIGAFSPIKSSLLTLGLTLAIFVALSVLGILQNKLFKLLKINQLSCFIEKEIKKVFGYLYERVYLKLVKN